MFILYFFLVPILYIPAKLFLYFIVWKFGKFSYDGFSAAGFTYHSAKDIFYSSKDAWQKNFGYTHLYDVGAPLFQMIIDTEPIRFYYNNKNWLITFWKGQYGMVTGAEIGIYRTNQQEVSKKTVYFPATDDEMLDMSIILYKKGDEITRVKAKHWWLAIFKLGMFSNPKDLTMDIQIHFPDVKMLEAFLRAFRKLGYKDKDFKVSFCTFIFTYKKPRTRKVWTRVWLIDAIRQSINHRNVKIYNQYLADFIDNNGEDDSKLNNKKMILVQDMIPDVFKNAAHSKTLEKESSNRNVIYLNDAVYSNVNKDLS